jgi:hypothetical protein
MSNNTKPNNKLKYYNKHCLDILLTIIIISIYLYGILHQTMSAKIQPIKDDWVNQRCKPYIIPIAGMINTSGDESSFSATATNFEYCIQNILKSITSSALQPITYSMTLLNSVLDEITDAINDIRNLFDSIRSAISDISSEIYTKILNVVIPVQGMFLSLNDLMSKIVGGLTTTLYVSIGTYDTMSSTLQVIYSIIIIILVALAIVIVILFAIPFVGWGLATVSLAIFAVIAVMAALYNLFLTGVLQSSVKSVPGAPSCFHRNTKIRMHNNSYKIIKDIQLDDILHDGSRVTATTIASAENQILYSINDIIVTSEHSVLYMDKWIPVKDHPNSQPIDINNEKYVYCINTTSKQIHIGNHIFSDWDDLENHEIKHIENNCAKYFSNIKLDDYSNIHKYLDGGFTSDTIIIKKNGIYETIDNIKINDILEDNSQVLGIIKIKASKFNKYVINGNIINGGPNLLFSDNFNKTYNNISTLSINNSKIYNAADKLLYHLVTDSGKLIISNINFYDYNGCIEQFLYN